MRSLLSGFLLRLASPWILFSVNCIGSPQDGVKLKHYYEYHAEHPLFCGPGLILVR